MVAAGAAASVVAVVAGAVAAEGAASVVAVVAGSASGSGSVAAGAVVGRVAQPAVFPGERAACAKSHDLTAGPHQGLC
jgi:hypothetical protein